MATSEKLIIVANNTEKVFNAGYNKALKENPPGTSEEELQQKYNEGYTIGWQDGASSGSNLWYENGYGDGKREGVEEGKQAEYDAFWDNYQRNGNRTIYTYAFAGGGWNNETFKPKYPMMPTDAMQMFDTCSLTDFDFVERGIDIDFSKATTMTYIFKNCRGIKRMGTIDCSSCKDLNRLFYGCAMETVDNLIVHENLTYSNTFDYASIINITISGTIGKNGFKLTCSTLSKASIESIINALSTTTEGLTITLSAEAVENAFTDTEWTALENTKTNWNISLV